MADAQGTGTSGAPVVPAVGATAAVGAPLAPAVAPAVGAPLAPAVAPATAVGSGYASQMGAAASNAMRTVTESPGLMVAAVFILLFIIFVAIYIYVQLKVGLKYYTALAKPLNLNKVSTTSLASDASFPKAGGREFTYGFWVFYNNIESSNKHKLLLRRGDNPIVYFDNKMNKMYVRLRTGLADLDGAVFNTINDKTSLAVSPASPDSSSSVTNAAPSDIDFHDDVCHYVKMTVDYVPLQRWVFYTLSVDNDFVTMYQDGEIHSVMNLSAQAGSATGTGCKDPSTKLNRSVIGVSKTSGDMYVGGTVSASAPDAVLSRIVFFNYAITLQDVQALYSKGPMPQNILSQLGLPVYGLRNPFYRIDGLSASDATANS